MEIDYFTMLKFRAWVDSYFKSEKLEKMPDVYMASMLEELKETGRTCISQFNSVTDKQIYFSDDPYNLL